MAKLEIIDLWASVEDKQILKGVNATFNTGEFHALIGPNGNGKSTLLGVIMGNPKYKINKGDILLDGVSILDREVHERSKLGLFLAMQYPQEVPGIKMAQFLKAAVDTRRDAPMGTIDFYNEMNVAVESLHMSSDLPKRYLNQGFSGGEKKKNEILQMKLLKPKFALLDEIDSGLDVDALNVVTDEVNGMKGEDFCAVIISHYKRLYSMIKPTHVHIIIDGKIVKTGGYELVELIDQNGYAGIKDELGIKTGSIDEFEGM